MQPYPRPIRFGDFPDEAKEKLTADKAIEAHCKQVKVLYHSVKMVDLGWDAIYKATSGRDGLEDPGSGKEQMLWFQYKLNARGYLAGPLSGEKNDQTKRAIKRYSYAMPGLAESDDGSLIKAKLTADEGDRPHLIENRDVLTDVSAMRKITLDHNYYYVNRVTDEKTGDIRDLGLEEPFRGLGEANLPDGHAALDAEKLDGFEIPLQVKVLLVGKADKTGKGVGIDAPLAVGPVNCTWSVFDPPETLTLDPALTLGVAAKAQTKAKTYLDLTFNSLTKNKGNALNAQDNCPKSRGGVRPDDPEDMTAYFVADGLPGLHSATTAGKAFLSRFHNTFAKAKQRAQVGTSAVLFRGSYIAGDNWIVQAQLSFQGLPGEADLKKDHLALGSLSGSFGEPEKADKDPLAARTGKMTLWRRHTVRKVVDWWDYPGAPGVNWAIIQAAYRAAFVEFVPPVTGPVVVDTLPGFDTAGYVKTLQETVEKQKNAALFAGKKDSQIGWRKESIIPITFIDQEKDESILAWPYRAENNAGATVQAFIGGGGFYYGLYRVPARVLRSLIDTHDGPGLILVRFDHLPAYVLPDKLNAADKLKFAANTLKYEYFEKVENPDKTWRSEPRETVITALNYRDIPCLENFKSGGGPSIGVDWGTAFITHQHFALYEDSFIVLHELGHCLYLGHAAERKGHDPMDANCTMFYPEQEPAKFEMGWGLRAHPKKQPTVPMFCGKCLLKLRGWRIEDAIEPKLPAASS